MAASKVYETGNVYETGTATDSGVRALLRSLTDNITLLFRQETALLKAELTAKAKTTMVNSVLVVVGAVLGCIGLFWLLFAAVAALATIWPFWLASLVVGGGILLIGLILALIGINTLKRMSPTPERTVRTVKTNIEMIKEKA